MFEILFRFVLMVYFFVNLGSVLKYCSDFLMGYFLVNRAASLLAPNIAFPFIIIDVKNYVLYKVAFCLKSDAYNLFSYEKTNDAPD